MVPIPKICIKCNESKLPDQFAMHNWKPRNVCKPCYKLQRSIRGKSKNYPVVVSEKICKMCSNLKNSNRFGRDKTQRDSMI